VNRISSASLKTKLKFSVDRMNVVFGCSIMFAHHQEKLGFLTLTTTKVGKFTSGPKTQIGVKGMNVGKPV